MDYISDEDRQRFWQKVVKRPGRKACWLWLGKGRVGWGYGSIRIGRDSAATTSSRAAWRIQRGAIPKGLCVLHSCDNPLCVRASHLFLGTRRQNSEDMFKKNRQARGKKLPHTKLDAEKVRAIRRRYAAGEHPQDLAREFGINVRGCWFVIQRLTWSWVCLPGESPALPRSKRPTLGRHQQHRTYPRGA